MTNYEELYHALKVLKDYCTGDICTPRECDDCAMSTDGHSCKIMNDIPALWEIHEPKATLWGDK